jgi:hypothetical protein
METLRSGRRARSGDRRERSVSFLETGVTASQFGNPTDSGSPSGMIIGWAPGAHISAGANTMNYWRIPGW